MQERYLTAWKLTFKEMDDNYTGAHTILSYERKTEPSGRSSWFIVGICGNCSSNFSMRHSSFVKSSTCDLCSRLAGHNTKDGRSSERLYTVYHGMISRCYYNQHPKYHRYGARGITVSKEWLDDYQTFKTFAYANGYKEVQNEEHYKDYQAVDRIDNNGNYEPSNVQFITVSENSTKRTGPFNV